ncbi:MAG: hypothetical protein H7Y38_03705 [Armatimonadetes bacterium]|nr:hypothetical protein [Armatimonadota bacterium]
MEKNTLTLSAPSRETVARAIVLAATLDEFDQARQQFDAYVRANPADTEIAELRELLDTLSAAVTGQDVPSGLGGDAKD